MRMTFLQILKSEPELFDNSIYEALYSPCNDNREVVVQTRINAKDNTVREAQPSTPERQVEPVEQNQKYNNLKNRHS